MADRSVAMRGGSSWAWLWVVFAVLGGAGGAYYYYQARGFAAGPTAAAADSAPTPALAPDPGTAPAGDSAPAAVPVDTTRAAASTPPPPDAAPVPAPAPTRRSGPANQPSASPPAASPPAGSGPPVGAPAEPAATDSGGVRLVGLPRGSTVLIDERQVTEPVTRLPAGRHALAISAPRFNFFSDTIVIRPGEILELTPQLTPIGAPDTSARPRPRRAAARCEPGPGYNTDGSCFDERPKPVNPPFVPLPEGIEGNPRPSLLWVKVSAEGRTVDLRQLRASDDAEYERAVRNFVWTVTWHPALKEGAPVEAWTQMLFPPQRQ